jgi:hypothetical protein
LRAASRLSGDRYRFDGSGKDTKRARSQRMTVAFTRMGEATARWRSYCIIIAFRKSSPTIIVSQHVAGLPATFSAVPAS